MKLSKVAGSTSEIWQVFIQDSTSATGAGLAGLVYNSSGLTAYYHRDGDTTATAITLATMTVGTFTSSGFKEIDSSNMPGWYQFCPPNAAIAAGAKSCGFHLKGATNMVPLPIEVQLTTVNPDVATYGLALAKTTNLTGFNDLAAADVRTAVGLASANLDTQLDALPTNAELATALGTADDAVLAAIAALNNLSQANIRTAVGLGSANLDTQLDALPTNAELATALGTADDAVLAAIAALNNLSQANIRTALGLASANLDTQLDALPTNAELATALGTADDAVLAAIAALNNLSAANIRTAVGLGSANLDTQLAAVQADTDNIQTRLPAALVSGRIDAYTGAMAAAVLTAAAVATDAIDADAIASDALIEFVDALLKRDLSAVTGEAARSPLNALRFLRNKWTISGSTLSVKKEDDATEAWAATLTTDSGAAPITTMDPS